MNTRSAFVIAGVWALAVAVAVHTLQFPGSVPDFAKATGGGILLDAVPAFSADEVYERLESYGASGRRNYLFRNVTVDVLLPLSVVPFLFLFMRRGLKRASLAPMARIFLLSVPLVYVAFDLVENGSVVMLLSQYPARVDALAASLPYLTIVKRLASIAALIAPVVMFGVAYVRQKGSARPSAA